MSNVAPVDSTPTKGRPLGLGEAVLQGRLSLVRKAGNIGFSHLIILPAPNSVQRALHRRGGRQDSPRLPRRRYPCPRPHRRFPSQL